MVDREQFAKDNLGLVYDFMDKYHIGKNRDDIVDVLFIGYTKALNIWDSTKGEFSTLAYACMQKEYFSYYKYTNRERRKEGGSVISLNTIIGEDDSSELLDFIPDEKQDVARQATNKIILNQIYLIALEILDEQQLEIFISIWLLGKSKIEIAKKYGITKQGIDGIKNRIIKKLKDYYAKRVYEPSVEESILKVFGR